MNPRPLQRASAFVNDWQPWRPLSTPWPVISVIVPVFRPYHLVHFVDHTLAALRGRDAELLLIDDCGSAAGVPDLLPARQRDDPRVRVLRHDQNRGRPPARNTGAAHALGDILAFVDQDMFVAPTFFEETVSALARHDLRAITLGMRDTVAFQDLPTRDTWPADLRRDWRHHVTVATEMVDLTVTGTGSAHNRCYPGRTLAIHDATYGLRDLGVAPKRTLGYWDLASMVVSHTMATGAATFRLLGGFPEWISGWGGEDIVIGFVATVRHTPLIPLPVLSLQAQHPPYSGSEAAKLRELKANIARYRRWARNLHELPTAPSPPLSRRDTRLANRVTPQDHSR